MVLFLNNRQPAWWGVDEAVHPGDQTVHPDDQLEIIPAIEGG